MLAACLLAATAAAAPGEATLRTAAETVTRDLLAGLFAERPSGRIQWLRGPGEVIVDFAGAAAAADSEYIVRRAAAGGGGFAETIAVVRIAEVRGGTARGIVLWSNGPLEAGDRVVAPDRVTILLRPVQTPGAAAGAADQWLESGLLADGRVRVIRADAATEARWRAHGVETAREYAIVIAPLMVPSADGAELFLSLRSLFTGQSLASSQATAARAGALAEDAPRPSPAPAAAASPAPPPAAAYGAAIKPAGPPAIRPGLGQGHLSVALSEPFKAVALGDVTGDGRQEVIAITDRRVTVFRWTGSGLAVLLRSGRLPAFAAYVHADAGDLDGDGRDELVLTVIRSVPRQGEIENSLQTVVVRLKGDRLVGIGRPMDRFARLVEPAGGKALLLTQEIGIYDPFEGPVTVQEWRDGRLSPGAGLALPKGLASLYGFAASDLDGDGRLEVALVGSKRRLQVLGPAGRVAWQGSDDLGEVANRGFAQTPRHPDYTGLGRTEALAEYLAVWRTIPRRVVLARRSATPDIVTLSNPRKFGLMTSSARQPTGRPGRVVGYGWDAGIGRFAKRWETDDLSGTVLDLAVGDLRGDGHDELVVLTGAKQDRTLEVLALYRNGT